MGFKIRKAVRNDVQSLLKLIKELAIYEKAPDQVKTSAKDLERDGFGKNKIYDCFVVTEKNNTIVGMALFYTKYSTWKGRCIFLEDIIVTKKFRGLGVGKLLFDRVVLEGKKMKVRKIEWQVLNWNKPAIGFYKKYDTLFDNDWINCKLVFE